jgi:hypothetical protein
MVAIAGALVLLITCQAFGDQPTLHNYTDFLDVQAKKMIDHSEDFLAFAKSKRDNPSEWQICYNLHAASLQTADYLDTISSLIYVYSNISRKTDRLVVRPFIQKKVKLITEQISLSVKQVNNEVVYTNNPAVAASGTRLREDLRKVIEYLHDFHLP